MMERQYKDSGIEWIGGIPEGWELFRPVRYEKVQSYNAWESGVLR